MSSYFSQEHEIRRMAIDLGGEENDVLTQFKQEGLVPGMYHDEFDAGMKQYRAEKVVGERFFRDVQFPGRIPTITSEDSAQVMSTDDDLCDDATRRARHEVGSTDRSDIYRPRRKSMGTPWDHDMFNQANLDTVQDVSSVRDDFYRPAASCIPGRVDSYRPSYAAKDNPQPPTLSKVESENVSVVENCHEGSSIKSQILASGVSEQEYERASDNFAAEIGKRYGSTITAAWKTWKVRSKLWSFFFNEPLPQIEPTMSITPAPTFVASMPAVAISATSASTPSIPATAETYKSCLGAIEKKLVAKHTPPRALYVSYKDRVKYANNRFSKESTDWRKWFAEACVWKEFFPNLPFIGVEPRRIMTWSPIPIQSTGQDTPLATNSAKTSIAQSKPRGGGTLKYEMQESRMREKAISQNLGRDFGTFLQTARDRVRARHKDCSREVRHYLADTMIWTKFWPEETFPGKKPAGGHTTKCLKRTLKEGTSVPASQSRSVPVQAPITLPVPARPAAPALSAMSPPTTQVSMPLAKIPAFTLKDTSSEDIVLRVVLEISKKDSPHGQMTKATTTFKGVAKSKVLDIRRGFVRNQDGHLTDLEHSLQCNFESELDREHGVLELVVVARETCNFASAELAFKLTTHWTKSCVRGDVIDFTEFARNIKTSGYDDPGHLDASVIATPICVVVNGRYTPFCYAEFENVHHGFSKDLHRRAVVETAFGCHFVMIKTSVESGLVHLIAHPSSGDDPARLDNLPATMLWHTEEGSAANIFLEAWVMKVAPAPGLDHITSFYDFWLEYNKSSSWTDKAPVVLRSVSRSRSVEQDGVNDLIAEESIKAEGLLRVVYDEAIGKLMMLKEYREALLQGSSGGANAVLTVISPDKVPTAHDDGGDILVLGENVQGLVTEKAVGTLESVLVNKPKHGMAPQNILHEIHKDSVLSTVGKRKTEIHGPAEVGVVDEHVAKKLKLEASHTA